MPRKRENGFGSFGFKDVGRETYKGKYGAPGKYPGNRQYGTSVTRTVIEKYDLDSDWVKWRKGYEYYNQAAWYVLEEYDDYTKEYRKAEVKSKLYQGTPDEVDIHYEGYKFATQNADSNNHYVMKRIIDDPAIDIGSITQVRNDFYYDFDKTNEEYAFYKRLNQILCEFNEGINSDMVFSMIGDRITDGVTEGTLSFCLNSKQQPALYVGKNWKDPETNVKYQTSIDVSIYMPGITWPSAEAEAEWNWDDIVGELIYMPNMFVKKDVNDLDVFEFTDGAKYFTVDVEETSNFPEPLLALDLRNEGLPPSLFDIAELPALFEAVGTYTIKGQFLYRKSIYQPYFGDKYLTGDVVKQDIQTVSYDVLPFAIAGYRIDGDFVHLQAVPFDGELKMYGDLKNGFLAFDSRSFTRTVEDTYEKNGETVYYHRDYLPVYKDGMPQPLKGKEIIGYEQAPRWLRLETEVNPWMDEVFTNDFVTTGLRPAVLYSCSCPSYAKAMLRAPESTDAEGDRKINRQKRYPLPTVQSTFDYDGIGINEAAGQIESWETRDDRMKFRMCKHTVAARFIDRIKTQEPSQYQSIEGRLEFEKKLQADMAEVAQEFHNSYQRGGITTIEILFAMSQVLNLDNVQLAYTIFTSLNTTNSLGQFTQAAFKENPNTGFRLRL